MMQGLNVSPNRGRDGITRRSALTGLLAAMMTPTLVTHASTVPQRVAFNNTCAVETPLPRLEHTATLLGDGSILVTGGFYQGLLASTQIYDPTNDTWTATGDLNIPRRLHAASLLADGSVLVAGGQALGPLADAEVYDPTTGLWTRVAPLNIPRYGHSAATTAAGAVVVGGYYYGPLIAAEVFNGTRWTLL